VTRIAPLLVLAAGCSAPAPAPSGPARMEIRYFDATGALRERHALDVPVGARFVHEISGVTYRFTLHEDWTVSL